MGTTIECTRIQTRKAALGETRTVVAADDAALQPGEALLRLSRFGLTTNNITYAALGDSPLKYWSHFPTGDPAWGHMPVWGFADVVDSAVDGVTPGERFYGYFPIASHVRMQPVRVTARGFYDGAPHRQALVSAYNQYGRCRSDPAWSAEGENLQMLLRPLFITAWMLADFLEDNAFFGARRLLVSSASSKTASGTAFCLRGSAGPERVALTSVQHTGYVANLRCYDRVLAYDALADLPVDTPTLYLDFSGSAALRAAVRRHLGAALVRDCVVGFAQTTELPAQVELAGPGSLGFFAPDQIRKRNADWGPAEFNARFAAAQLAYYGTVGKPDSEWLHVTEHHGLAAAPGVIADLHAGRSHPRDGHALLL